jgi:two-component system OmpR family response regulator
VAELFTLEGNLTDTTFPEILRELDKKKVSGVLAVKKEEEEKKIYTEEDRIIFASSNNDDDRLGEFLLRKKRITQKDYDKSVELLKTTGKRQGTIFVELGCLTPEGLYWAVRAQIRDIVWSLFNWEEGSFSFNEGAYKQDEVIKLSTNIRDAIIEGVNRIREPERLLRYIGSKETLLAPTKGEDISLLSDQYKHILRLLTEPKTVYQISQESLFGELDTLKTIYALLVLEYLARR